MLLSHIRRSHMVGPAFVQGPTMPSGTLALSVSALPPLMLAFIPRSLPPDCKMAAAAPGIVSMVQGGERNGRRKGGPCFREGKLPQKPQQISVYVYSPELSRGHP